MAKSVACEGERGKGIKKKKKKKEKEKTEKVKFIYNVYKSSAYVRVARVYGLTKKKKRRNR